MQLLNIFHSGLFFPLSGVAALLVIIFWYQAFKAHNSEWVRQDTNTGKNIHIADKTPFHSIPQFWFGWAIIALWAIVMFVFVAQDYKGV